MRYYYIKIFSEARLFLTRLMGRSCASVGVLAGAMCIRKIMKSTSWAGAVFFFVFKQRAEVGNHVRRHFFCTCSGQREPAGP